MNKVSAKKITKYQKEEYTKLINSLISSIDNIIIDLKDNFFKNEKKSKSIFISEEKFNFFTDMFNSYIDNIESEKLDAEKLKSEIENHDTV